MMSTPKLREDPMVHRSMKLVISLVALALALFGAVPVSAYNHVNTYDLRLTRLDPLACGTTISLQALVTEKKGGPASGVTVLFTIEKGPGDTVNPSSADSNGSGIAITHVTIDCSGQPPHQVVASIAGDASARITLCGSGQSCTRETDPESVSSVASSQDTQAPLTSVTQAAQVLDVSIARALTLIHSAGLPSPDGF